MSTVIQHVESSAGAQTNVTVAWSTPTTHDSILVAWANSDAVVDTPSGYTLIDSQINGNGAYVWYKVAAGTDADVAFTTTVTGKTITCGIIELGGLLTTGIPSAHSPVYASSVAVSSPPATITIPVTSYVLGLAFLHNLNDGDPGAFVSWSSLLTNFADVASDVGVDASHWCHTFVGGAGAIAPSGPTINATWTNSTGADRNTFLITFQELGTAATPTVATATGAGLTTAGATVEPSIARAQANGSALDASVVTFTGSGAPGGQATGTGSAPAVTVTVSPSSGRAAGVGTMPDATIIFTGPSGGAGVAWPAGPKVSANAATATGTGAVNATSQTVARTAGIATATGAARDTTVTFGTADVTADAGIATGTGQAWRPGFTVTTNSGIATATGLTPTPVAWLQPNGELATATGTSYGTGTTESLSVAEGVGAAYDATTTGPVPIVYKFECPSWDQIPPIVDDAPALSNRLMRFFKARPMGRNIWTLPDGTLTFDEPWPLVEDTGANRDSLFPSDPPRLGSSWSNLQTITYTHVYWGGHVYYFDFSDINQEIEAFRISLFLQNNGYNPSDWLVLT